MSRSTLFCLAGLFLLMRAQAVAIAQDRSYDQNALRLDANFGDVSIVRGIDGKLVGKIGVFRGIDVAKVVQTSPDAVNEARQFQRNYRPGNIALGLGLMTMGAAVGASRIHDLNSGITTGLSIATVGLIAYGGTRLQKAYTALHKSLWLYNRDLK
jgi:hypothetical protein